MRRIVVVGSSGSGKTRFAKRLAGLLGLPYLELDSVFHRGGWNRLKGERFLSEVAEFASGPEWVVDGNYTSQGTREVLWPRADTIIWLDLPKRVIMWRVVSRTIRRVVTREPLWEGVREPWSNLYSADPERNIIVWAWTRFDHTRDKFEASLSEGDWGHAEVHRLRTKRQGDELLAAVADHGR